ncbi:alkene reductase [Acidovorax sp.]|uniref:alkene reductase n=1 Tax=Acidovorax sp. TaxID=1872122 RepID=UPI003BAE987E
MSRLFEPLQVGAWRLASRVVMAPMTRNRAPGALPTASMATYYGQRAGASEGAALIVSEATAISPSAQGYSDVPGLWSDAQVAAWHPVTEAVHARGGHFVAQLWHVGRVSHTSLQPDDQAPVAPSAITAQARTYLVDAQGQGGFVETSAPRALTEREIHGIVEDYAHAAACARAAGFDGVEVHAANGYLIDQFLRSGANQRTDAWGGSIDNRVRFLVAVTRAIGERIGGDRVGVRLSPVTPTNDAHDPEPQALFNAAVCALGPLGLAYIHVVVGQGRGARDHQQGEAEFSYEALRAAYREGGGRGAWMLNNGYDLALAQEALARGDADLIAFGRPFIANPDLSRRWREHLPLSHAEATVFYGGGDAGYIDFPTAAPLSEPQSALQP